MSTSSTAESPSAPEFTSLSRVASIPLVRSSLDTVDGVLSTNTYLSSPYTAAKNISTSAAKLTEPLQVRLAPLVVHADGYVNKGLDAVQAKFPYPFEAKPEEVVNYVRDQRQNVTDYATKALNDNVKTPALNVAQNIDQRFTPVVDIFESAVTYLPGSSNSAPSSPLDSKYQYQRAFSLSKTIPVNIYAYSSDQLKQLQEHNSLVQNATETANSLAALATSSVTTAQSRIYQVSDNMISELQRIRELSSSLAESLQTQAQNLPTPSEIPSRAHEVYADYAEKLSPTINELRNIVAEDAPISDKVQRMTSEVRDKVSPLLETIRARVAEYLPGAAKEEVVSAPAKKVVPHKEGGSKPRSVNKEKEKKRSATRN